MLVNEKLIVLLLLLLGTINLVCCKDLIVNPQNCVNADTYCSLNDAVNAAIDGAQILLESPLIILNETIQLDKSITIRKSPNVEGSHVHLISKDLYTIMYEENRELDEYFVIDRENSTQFFNHTIFNINTQKPVYFYDIETTFEDAFIISSIDNLNIHIENFKMKGTLFLIFFSGDNQVGSIFVLHSHFEYGGTLFIVPPELKRSNQISNIVVDNCTWNQGATHYTYFSTQYQVKAYISDTISSVISIVNFFNVKNVAIKNSQFLKNVRGIQIYSTGLIQGITIDNCELANGYHTQVDIRSEISNLKDITIRDTTLRDMDKNFSVKGSATALALVTVNYLENILFERVKCINNYAIWSGGSLYFQGSITNLTIKDSYFERNEAIGEEEFGLGGAIHIYSVFSASNGLSILNNTFIKNRAARMGSAIYITAFGSLDHLTIAENEFKEQLLTEQGVVAMVLQTSTNLRILNNMFIRNQVESAPLFIESASQRTTEIYNLTFIDNESKYERGYSLFVKGRDIVHIHVTGLVTKRNNENMFGIFYYFEFSQSCDDCIVEDIICKYARTCFSFHVVEIEGTMRNIQIANCNTGVILDSTASSTQNILLIENSSFEKTINYGFYGNSVGVLTFKNVTFANNGDYGLWISNAVSANIINSRFELNGFGDAEIKGGGATLHNTNVVNVKDSFFNKNRGRWGGCLETSHNDIGMLKIDNSYFRECDAFHYGGAVSALRVDLNVTNSKMYDNFATKGGAIYCEASNFCYVATTFIEHTDEKQLPTISEGAGINSIRCQKTFIIGNTFVNLKSQKGGSIFVDQGSKWVGIKNNQIYNSSSQFEGAAIFSSARHIEFDGGKIAYSKSDRIGILYLSNWMNIEGILPTLYQNEVLDSTENIYGNGLFVDQAASEGENIALLDEHGKNATIFSFPQKVIFTNFSSDTHENSLIKPTVIEVEPGELFTLVFHAIDKFKKQITSYPRLETSLYFNDKLLETTNYQFKEDSGGHLFRNIRITLSDPLNSHFSGNTYGPSPNGTFGQHTIKVVMLLGTDRRLVSKLPFYLKQCRPGFRYEGNICTECDEEHYSLIFNSTRCYKCDPNEGCLKTDKKSVTISQGYWGYTRQNDSVYLKQCINNYCEGGILDDSNQQVNCNGNRNPEFPLCAVCQNGYSEWGGQCVECDKTNELLVIFLYVPYFIVFTYYMLWTSYDPLKGAQVKIFAVFIQTFFIIIDVRRWLFSNTSTKTNAFRGFLNLESIFDASNIYSLFFIKSCPFSRSAFIYMFSQIAHNMIAWILIFFGFTVVVSIRGILKVIRKTRAKAAPVSESVQETIIGGESTQNLLEMNELDTQDIDEGTELDELSDNMVNNEDTEYVNQSSDEEGELLDFSSQSVFRLITNCMFMPFRLLIYFFRKQRYLFTKPSSYSLTLFNLLIFSYQPVARIVVQYIFSCITIERNGVPEFVLMNFTDVKCDGILYNSWYYFYLVVGILMLAIPIFIFIFLTAIRNQLKNPVVVKYIGSVYAHYRPSLYWFEAVVLTKRLLLIAGIILFDFLQIEDHHFVYLRESYFSLVLFIDITILFIARPYRHKSENRVAIVANGILLLSISLQRGEQGSQTRLINMILCLTIISLTSIALFIWVVLTRPYVKPYVNRKWNQFYPYIKRFLNSCLNVSDNMLTNIRKKKPEKRRRSVSLSKKLMENDALNHEDIVIEE